MTKVWQWKWRKKSKFKAAGPVSWTLLKQRILSFYLVFNNTAQRSLEEPPSQKNVMKQGKTSVISQMTNSPLDKTSYTLNNVQIINKDIEKKYMCHFFLYEYPFWFVFGLFLRSIEKLPHKKNLCPMDFVEEKNKKYTYYKILGWIGSKKEICPE